MQPSKKKLLFCLRKNIPVYKSKSRVYIDVRNNYYCRTNIGEIRVIFFSEYGQTLRISESSYGNMSAHKKFKLKAQNLELAVSRYMYTQMTGTHNSIIIYSFIREVILVI